MNRLVSRLLSRSFPITVLVLAGCSTSAIVPDAARPAPVEAPRADPAPPPRPVRIGLALGGGAARGFAHIGVIKVLEANGVVPDLVVGTSAGSLVASLYAHGLGGFELQQRALKMDESVFADWTLGGRGMFRGEALQTWVNQAVGQRPIEKLKRPLGITATDLATGEFVLFQRGNTGMAVRASSAVPGVFAPAVINGREYVDGGLVSPVPVRPARDMGADFVIAVDISSSPVGQPTGTMSDLLLQTFTIMGRSINRFELGEADVVVRPDLHTASTDFSARHQAILAGEVAMTAVLPELRAKLAAKRSPAPAVRPH